MFCQCNEKPFDMGPSSLAGASEKGEESSGGEVEEINSSELFTRTIHKEHQARVLASASDFLQYTEGSEDDACSDILEAFPEVDGMYKMHCQFQEAPHLLKKTLQPLFPDRDITNSKLSVLTMSHKTQHDMTGWSAQVEEERESLVDTFVTAAKEICGR